MSDIYRFRMDRSFRPIGFRSVTKGAFRNAWGTAAESGSWAASARSFSRGTLKLYWNYIEITLNLHWHYIDITSESALKYFSPGGTSTAGCARAPSSSIRRGASFFKTPRQALRAGNHVFVKSICLFISGGGGCQRGQGKEF